MDQQQIFLKNNNKFWHCQLVGQTELQIRVGHLVQIQADQFEDIQEQEIVKSFDTDMECFDYMTESIALKMEKGYVEHDMKKLIKPSQKNQYKIQVTKPDNELKSIQLLQREIKDSALSISQLTDKAVTEKSLGSPRSSVNSDRFNKETDLGKPGHGPISVLLAQTWADEIDPKGHYISEKLDGMRMIWTGSTMYSRNGNVIKFPKFFVEGWPKAQLDGELWLERDQFQKLVSITKRLVPVEEDWRRVKYMVFDAPGLNAPFKVRYERFKNAIEQANNPHLVCVPHILCNGMEHLSDELQKVTGEKGEGLMLRDPEGRYEGRRSKVLLKVKTFEDDEAVVLAHERGEGRCAGMVGALRVKNSWGCEFSIGSGMTDDIRRNPPKIGIKITYKYWGTSKNNVPRFPIYLRERPIE